MARPTKLTDEVSERVVRALRAGNFPDVAARHAGVHPATYYRWMERGAPARDAPEDAPYRRFRAEVERALADAEAAGVGLILQSARGGSWQAAAWLLERRFSARWRPGSAPVEAAPEPPIRNELIDQEVERLVAEFERRDARGE